MRQIRLIITALILVSPMAAQADLIQIDDGSAAGTWEITVVQGTFADLADLLMSQTWWGDHDLAEAFAAAYGVSYPGANGEGLFGSYFAYGQHNGWFGTVYADVSAIGAITGWIWDLDVRDNRTRFFGVATRVGDAVAVPEPGTLGLLGLGLLGMGMARRRKTG